MALLNTAIALPTGLHYEGHMCLQIPPPPVLVVGVSFQIHTRPLGFSPKFPSLPGTG